MTEGSRQKPECGSGAKQKSVSVPPTSQIDSQTPDLVVIKLEDGKRHFRTKKPPFRREVTHVVFDEALLSFRFQHVVLADGHSLVSAR
jgi:hypothetical protein